jgi:hypothetical protein
MVQTGMQVADAGQMALLATISQLPKAHQLRELHPLWLL